MKNMTKSDIFYTKKSRKSKNMFFGKSSHLRKTCKTVWKITDLITFFDTFLTKKNTLYTEKKCKKSVKKAVFFNFF